MLSTEISERLFEMLSKADQAINLLTAANVSEADEATIRQLVMSLKESLHSEYVRVRSKLREEMSPEEFAFYRAAIEDAWGHNPSFTNLQSSTKPTVEKWFPGLNNISHAISYALSSLERQ